MLHKIWHMILWGRSMDEFKLIEGDIINVVSMQKWKKDASELRLCLIVPCYGLSSLQASCLKDKGNIMRRKYRIPFESLDCVRQLSKSDIRDEKKYYQPFLSEGLLVNMEQMKLVQDRDNQLVDLNTIYLRA